MGAMPTGPVLAVAEGSRAIREWKPHLLILIMDIDLEGGAATVIQLIDEVRMSPSPKSAHE